MKLEWIRRSPNVWTHEIKHGDEIAIIRVSDTDFVVQLPKSITGGKLVNRSFYTKEEAERRVEEYLYKDGCL